VPEAASEYYPRFLVSGVDRLDENFNNPRFDQIERILSDSRFPVVLLDAGGKYLKEVISGTTPERIQYQEKGIPFLGAGDIRDGQVELASAPRVSKEYHTGKLASSQIRKCDVLVTMAGTIGRCAVFEYDLECNCNQAIAILRPNQEFIVPDYLVHYFNSSIGQIFFEKLQHVSSQPNINLEEIRQIRIIMPTRARQEEICQKMKTGREEISILQAEIANSRTQIGNQILDELGLSVPIGLNYFFKEAEQPYSEFYVVPANELKDRLHYLWAHPKLRLPDILITKYRVTTFEEASREAIQRGVQPEYDDSGPMAIKTVDLKNTCIDYDNAMRVSQDFFDSCMKNKPGAILKSGDILIAATGYVSMGKVDLYDNENPAVASVDLLILRTKAAYDPRFVVYFLRSALGQMQFEKWWSGSSGQIHIYENEVNQFILPESSIEGVPLQKQKEIADRLTSKLADTLALEKEVEKRRRNLMAEFEHEIIA